MARGRKKAEEAEKVEEPIVIEKHRKPKREYVSNSAGAVYGLGLIGAAVYYIQNASNFTEGFIGLLKAIVWPAFLVYELLKFLQM